MALTGWYQVRQTQARQLQSGNTPPNPQMQAMTKVFPVFFAFICFGLNAGATLYFVVSNIWRIGQQHLVLGKLYDQGVASGDIKPVSKDEPGRDRDQRQARPRRRQRQGEAGGEGPGHQGDSPKGSGAKNTGDKPSNGSGANGNAKGQGMSSGARRKKRKR